VELLLIRHGLPRRVENATGPADPPLTELGHRQAEAMASWLADDGIAAVYVSPLVRARETAAALELRLGLRAEIVDGIAEFDRDERSYVPIEELRATKDPRWFALASASGGEERRAWHQRAVDALEGLVAAHPGRRVAAVCHGGVINTYVCHVIGLEPRLFFEPRYCSVHRVLAASSGERSLLALNESPFLRGLEAPGAR